MNPLGHHVNLMTGGAKNSVHNAPGAILKVLNTAVDRDALKKYNRLAP